MLVLIDAYRVTLAPLLGGHCRFWPSCSVYAQEAVALHGAARGALLAGRRLLRCHPFHRGGLDPVPPAAAHRLPPGGSPATGGRDRG